MKKGILSASILSIVIVALALLNPFTNSSKKRTGFGLPVGMSNVDARQEWEVKRIADPTTGEIPDGIRKKELAYAQTLPSALPEQRGGFRWNFPA